MQGVICQVVHRYHPGSLWQSYEDILQSGSQMAPDALPWHSETQECILACVNS